MNSNVLLNLKLSTADLIQAINTTELANRNADDLRLTLRYVRAMLKMLERVAKSSPLDQARFDRLSSYIIYLLGVNYRTTGEPIVAANVVFQNPLTIPEYISGGYEVIVYNTITSHIEKTPLVPTSANNGLTKSGNNIQLGGTLLQHTTIYIDQDLDILSRFTGTGLSIHDEAGEGRFARLFAGDNDWGYVNLNSSNTFIGMFRSSPSSTMGFNFIAGTGTNFTDTTTSTGIRYASDYSSANIANPRWIPDKAYVDSRVSGLGSGTVNTIGITTSNGISGTSSGGNNPRLTITLGAITPTSVNGVSAATIAFLDATSSIQTQLNGKASLTGSYANPSWITSLAYSKLTGTPTTVSGYGITDILSQVISGFSSTTGTLSTSDTITSALNKLNGNIGLKAALLNPVFTGNPTAPTPITTDNSTSIATTAYVQNVMASTAMYFSTANFSGDGKTSGTAFTLITDTTPTSGSVNPIQSGGVYAALASKGVGSVTSVIAGTGLTGGTITSTGTFAIDYTRANSWSGLQTFNSAVTAVSALAQGAVFTPTLTASANNDVLAALDIAPTYTVGSFTGTQNLGIRMRGIGALGKVFGMSIVDTAHTGGNVLIGSLMDSGGTFSEPGIWMGSTFTASPSASNYVFNLDDGSGGAIINGPGSTNKISFRIGNTAKMLITTGGAMVLIPTPSAVNATATLTVAQMQNGVKVSSTTAVTLTTATATALITALGASQGSFSIFSIDNSASTASGAVTVALGTGITSGITPGLTIPIGKTATYAVYVNSPTTCVMSQIV